MVKSQIKYLTIEEGENLLSEFSSLYFHQYQDPLRSVFVHQPCFTCSLNGELVAFAILEMHRFRKASIWLGPIIKVGANTNLIWEALFQEVRKFKIGHLTLQTENIFIYNDVCKYLSKAKGPKLIRIQAGMSTAIKKLTGSEEDIFQSYSKHHQKEVQISKKKELKIRIVDTQKDFAPLVDLFLLMFKQKNIHHYPNELNDRLWGEFNYILHSKNGKVLIAEKDGKLVGGSIELFVKGASFYVFGATDKNVKLPISYGLLHYSFITLVDQGIECFDFGGYQQVENDEQFAKVSQFKGGFGVETKKYPERLILNTGGLIGNLIEMLISLRNFLLKQLGKHVS